MNSATTAYRAYRGGIPRVHRNVGEESRGRRILIGALSNYSSSMGSIRVVIEIMVPFVAPYYHTAPSI